MRHQAFWQCISNSLDARRYRRLRVIGAAPFGTDVLERGLVLRFTGLDAAVDVDRAANLSRGEAEESTLPALLTADEVAKLRRMCAGVRKTLELRTSVELTLDGKPADPAAREVLEQGIREAVEAILIIERLVTDVELNPPCLSCGYQDPRRFEAPGMEDYEIVDHGPLPPVPCPGAGCDRDLLRDNRRDTDAPGPITDCVETHEPGVGVFICGTCGTRSEWKITAYPPTVTFLRIVTAHIDRGV